MASSLLLVAVILLLGELFSSVAKNYIFKPSSSRNSLDNLILIQKFG